MTIALAVWMKCAILRVSVRLAEKVKFQVVALNFNWIKLVCVIMPSIWAASISRGYINGFYEASQRICEQLF